MAFPAWGGAATIRPVFSTLVPLDFLRFIGLVELGEVLS
jgi:hypothetical protein